MRLGLGSHAFRRLEAAGVVVLKHSETPFAWVRVLERLEHRALIHVCCHLPGPTRLDELPKQNFPVANSGKNFNTASSAVVLYLRVRLNRARREALAQPAVRAAAAHLGDMAPAFAVQEDIEVLDVDMHVHESVPPGGCLAAVRSREGNAVFDVLLGQGRLGMQFTEENAARVQRLGNRAD